MHWFFALLRALSFALFLVLLFALIFCIASLRCSFVLLICVVGVMGSSCYWCCEFITLLVLWIHHIMSIANTSCCFWCWWFILLLWVHRVAFAIFGLSHCWFIVLFLLLLVLCVTFIAKGSSHYVYSCWFIMLLLLLLVRHITYFVVGLVINSLHCWSHYIASHVVVGSLHSKCS